MARKTKCKDQLPSGENETLEDSREWWIDADKKEEESSSREWVIVDMEDKASTVGTEQALNVQKDKEGSLRKRSTNRRERGSNTPVKRVRIDTEFRSSLEHNPESVFEGRNDDEIQQVNNMVEVIRLLKSMVVG